MISVWDIRSDQCINSLFLTEIVQHLALGYFGAFLPGG
jgi:hypothetical protein